MLLNDKYFFKYLNGYVVSSAKRQHAIKAKAAVKTAPAERIQHAP